MYDPSKVLKIQLTVKDTEALIELLNFCSQAASLLSRKELEIGNGAKTALRFNVMARHAEEFSAMLVEHVKTGEPNDGQVH